MKIKYLQDKYIGINEESQQLKFRIDEEFFIKPNSVIRQASIRLEELDYTELYKAYSGIRKSQVEPRTLFKILVCAYMKGVYTSRKIEELCRENIQFIWLLEGQKAPDHCTISRFRSGEKTQQAIENLFYQYASLLEKRGFTEHNEVFIDGTKLESKANRYTFVWRKTVEKQLIKIREQAKILLENTDGNITVKKLGTAVENLDKEIESQGIVVKRGRGHRKPEIVRLRDKLKELHTRWLEYLKKLNTMGENRNSYSKTDPDATFMHMKEDHMRNGQLKPGYNVQFAVNSGFVTGVGVFSDRTDYATMIPFLNWLEEKHKAVYEKVVADSGYESLSNYRFLKSNGQKPFIKPQNYENSKTRKFKKQIGRMENMAYYEPDNCFLCKNGQHLDCYGTYDEKQRDGTTRKVSRYRCEDCTGCPYRSDCCKAKNANTPKELAVCWELYELREKSLQNITTDEGKLLRVNRSIQVEGAFGQLKHNRQFKRFLTCGKQKVLAELYFLALSQNIAKTLGKCNENLRKTHLCHPKAFLKF